MSAFMVEEYAIDDVLSHVSLLAKSYYRQGLTKLGYDVDDASGAWLARLGHDMLELNAKALRSRYRRRPSESTDYVLGTGSNQHAQQLKSLNSWLYQCCEGSVPSSKLYRFFDEVVARRLTAKVAEESPAYQAATWAY